MPKHGTDAVSAGDARADEADPSWRDSIMRRKLNSAEAEYLEAGEEPVHVLATGRLGRGEVEELHVWYLGDATVVEEHGQRVGATWAVDSILEPSEVIAEFEAHRW